MIRNATNGVRLSFRGIDKLRRGLGSGSGSRPSSLAQMFVAPSESRLRLTCLAAKHYAVLGLSPFASKADVKYAYKRLALKYHPDVARGETCCGKNKMFREIKAAYESIMQKLEEEEEMRTMNSFDEWDEWDERMGCFIVLVFISSIIGGFITMTKVERAVQNADLSNFTENC